MEAGEQIQSFGRILQFACLGGLVSGERSENASVAAGFFCFVASLCNPLFAAGCRIVLCDKIWALVHSSLQELVIL
jgi:hypothetical protein